jgi:hypothetical protein
VSAVDGEGDHFMVAVVGEIEFGELSDLSGAENDKVAHEDANSDLLQRK